MTIAEMILLVGAGAVLYFLFRPFQMILENVLEKIFRSAGKPKGWIIDAQSRTNDKPPQE